MACFMHYYDLFYTYIYLFIIVFFFFRLCFDCALIFRAKNAAEQRTTTKIKQMSEIFVYIYLRMYKYA